MSYKDPSAQNPSKLKVLIDSDFVPEVLFNREPYVDEVEALIDMVRSEKIQAYILDQCLSNILCFHGVSETEALIETAEKIGNLFPDRIINTNPNFFQIARTYNLPDIHSAIEIVHAIEWSMDAIITHYPENFSDTKIPIWNVVELQKHYCERILGINNTLEFKAQQPEQVILIPSCKKQVKYVSTDKEWTQLVRSHYSSNFRWSTTGELEYIVQSVQKSGIDIPLHAACIYKDLELGPDQARLYALSWLHQEKIDTWMLLIVVDTTHWSLSSKGIRLQVNDQQKKLAESNVLPNSKRSYSYIHIAGKCHENFLISLQALSEDKTKSFVFAVDPG